MLWSLGVSLKLLFVCLRGLATYRLLILKDGRARRDTISSCSGDRSIGKQGSNQ
jgi:hypothetical protein